MVFIFLTPWKYDSLFLCKVNKKEKIIRESIAKLFGLHIFVIEEKSKK
jgi:hypothetical protein